MVLPLHCFKKIMQSVKKSWICHALSAPGSNKQAKWQSNLHDRYETYLTGFPLLLTKKDIENVQDCGMF